MRLHRASISAAFPRPAEIGAAGERRVLSDLPPGLQGDPVHARGRLRPGGVSRRRTARTDSLLTLASETDGSRSSTPTIWPAACARIANDLQAYYVLGYYTTNTTWDGRLRSIKVRLKPKKATIRARRHYLAPTETEIAALSPGSVAGAAAALRPPPLAADLQTALGALDRQVHPSDAPALALLIPPQAFRSRGGAGPGAGGPHAFRAGGASACGVAGSRPLDQRTARVLDRRGRPLSVDVPLREGEVPETLIADCRCRRSPAPTTCSNCRPFW